MSSGAKKTILVNPDFFSSKRKNRGKPKQNKKKVPKDIQINTNALKRKLINKIREHQKEKNKQNSTEKNYPKNDGLIKNMSNAEKQEQIYFNDEFNNSMDYLQKIVDNRKKEEKIKEREKRKMKEIRQMRQMRQMSQMSQMSQMRQRPESLSGEKHMTPSNHPKSRGEGSKHRKRRNRTLRKKPEPPKYGILKGGKKMLYSEYKNKTRKKSHGERTRDINKYNQRNAVSNMKPLPPTPISRSKKMKDDEFTEQKIGYGLFKNSLEQPSHTHTPHKENFLSNKMPPIQTNLPVMTGSMTLNTSLPKSNIISKVHTPSNSLTLDLRKQFEEKREKDNGLKVDGQMDNRLKVDGEKDLLKDGEQKESDSKNRIDNKDRINENLQLFNEKKKEVKKSTENPISTPIYDELKSSIKLNAPRDKNMTNEDENKPVVQKMKKVKKTKITRIRKIYRLGRKKKNGKPMSLFVGILLPSEDNKNKIKQDIIELRNKNIDKIKNELKKQNLISIGSCAPESILINTYVNCVLIGGIKNKNPDRLLKNFMSSQGTDDFSDSDNGDSDNGDQ